MHGRIATNDTHGGVFAAIMFGFVPTDPVIAIIISNIFLSFAADETGKPDLT
jgi:divalent metal cation (Fe/Co/Zn/Cd) transporter